MAVLGYLAKLSGYLAYLFIYLAGYLVSISHLFLSQDIKQNVLSYYLDS